MKFQSRNNSNIKNILHTKHNDLFSIRLRKWITSLIIRQCNNSTMHTSSSPVTMSMPPKSSFFIWKYNLISKVWCRLYRALSNVLWTIRPWISWLMHSMPILKNIYYLLKYFHNVLFFKLQCTPSNFAYFQLDVTTFACHYQPFSTF